MNREDACGVRVPARLSLVVGVAGPAFLAVWAAACTPPNIVVRNVVENNNADVNGLENSSSNVNTNENSNCCGCGCCDCGCDDGCEDSGDPVEPDVCECPEGYEPTPAGDACVATETFEATFTGKEYDVCRGNIDAVYGKYGAQFPGGAVEQNSFWGQDNSTSDGRLNEVGVWACDASTGVAGNNPIGEWIGFSTCLEVSEPGDYLVGIAADNRVRFYVDGVLEFEKNSSSTAHFNYWYVQPISLSSGSHIVEMLGYNDGSIAAFGAEIYGPFPAGSLSTDADMMAADTENNILWSTGDLLGQTFDLGEETGWICPDGTAFDTCAAEPVCTSIDTVPCEGDTWDGGDDTGGDDSSGGDGGDTGTTDPTDDDEPRE